MRINLQPRNWDTFSGLYPFLLSHASQAASTPKVGIIGLCRGKKLKKTIPTSGYTNISDDALVVG
jgi:hypothetical protein